MINRTLVRTRVIQTLFAYFEDGDMTAAHARKELINSYDSTYSLYIMLLDLATELATFAREQIAENKSRSRATHRHYVPNYKFANNLISQQIFQNRQLRAMVDNRHLAWDAGMNAFPAIFKELQEQPWYIEYMHGDKENDYEEDKALWHKIYATLLPNNEALYNALEDLEISLDMTNWTTDFEVILSYVDKTVKRFDQEAGADQPLLQMFNSEEELQFGERLINHVIAHNYEYNERIVHHLKNWDISRIPLMDLILLKTALSEIHEFDDIAVQVSMNEYIELAKNYSSNTSYQFINGILEMILKNNE